MQSVRKTHVSERAFPLIGLSVLLGILFVLGGHVESAAQSSAQEKQEMQKALNEQIMSRPFSVPDEAQVNAYLDDALRRGVVPKPYTGAHWRRGYTCVDLLPYSYQQYLDCRYYYRYYGRYYW